MFRDNLNQICKERGTTLSALVRSHGISSSKVTAINHGSLPSEKMLMAFSKELNCSVMDFFDDDESEPDEDILRIYRNLSRKNKHEFENKTE